jgi:hypothetical protein
MLNGIHLLPGMKAILTVSGRSGMDLIHHCTRGDRKFVIMKNEIDMRGFVLEIKRVDSTMVRNET